MFKIFRWVLVVVGILTILSGLQFAFFQEVGTLPALNAQVVQQVADSPLDSAAADVVSVYLGVIGATTVFMGIVATVLALGPFRDRQPWAWYCLTLAIAGWYIVDTVVAARAGASILISFNTINLGFYAVPLAATWKEMCTSRQDPLPGKAPASASP